MPKFLDLWTRFLPMPQGEAAESESGEQPKKSLLSPSAGRGLAALALVGALLMLLGRTGEPQQPASGKVEEQPAAVTAAPVGQGDITARDLQAILTQIDGAGKVQVYVTMETGPEQVIAEEVTSQHTTSNGQPAGSTTNDVRETHRPVTVRDDAARTERPLVVVQKEPQVRGVVVVADGAASPRVRYALTQAVEVALGVPAHRIAVFPRE